MVLLDDEQIYFPTRPVISKHLSVSIPSIDVVLSQRQATEDIKIVTVTERGFVKQRPSTIKRRRVVPSDEIIKVVHDALAEEARRRGDGRRRRRGPTTPAMIATLTSIGSVLSYLPGSLHLAGPLHFMHSLFF